MQAPASVVPQYRRYRAKWWIRIFAFFFVSFSFTGLVSLWGGMFSGERPANTTEVVVPALLVLVGIGLVVHYFTTFVTLLPDAIELRTILSTKRLSFSEIRGRREYETTDSDGVKTWYIRLVPLDLKQPALEFQRVYNFDSAFEAWLSRLPSVQG